MRKLLIACLVVGSSFAAQSQSKMNHFLFMAVLEGLHNDGVNINLAKDIAEQKKQLLFVGKCPICTPVKRAFAAYYKGNVKVWGGGLSEPVQKKFKGTQADAQMALKMMIQRYVQAMFNNSSMTKKEKEAMITALNRGRKKGMSAISPYFGKFCPSCDGACKID